MEMLFLNDNMKSYLRQNIQKKLKVIDWITMLLGILGTSIACISVSLAGDFGRVRFTSGLIPRQAR